jgi:5-hydroxyisourate hydrolase
MPRLTTHVLDTVRGRPAAGVALRLLAAGGTGPALAVATTDATGRAVLAEALAGGTYQLEFAIGAYFAAHGIDGGSPRFLDAVVLRVGLDATAAHYHLPLLVSPWSYSTYRGQ